MLTFLITGFFVQEASAVPPPLYIIPGQLDFGQHETEAAFSIGNYGDESVTLFAKIIMDQYYQEGDWIALDHSAVQLDSQNKDTVTVSVSREGLEPGTYKAYITYDLLQNDTLVSGCGADILVSMVVSSPDEGSPTLAVDAHVVFVKRNQMSAEIKIANSGSGTLEWRVGDINYSKTTTEWINLDSSSGSMEAGVENTVTITVDRDDLQTFGLYLATIPIVSNGGNKSIKILLLN